MTYLVNDKCIKCKLTDCVDVCPVDCFYEGKNMLVIKPDECIDCGVCEPECPINAIVPDTNNGVEKWLEINTKYSEIWPNINKKKDPLEDHKKYEDEESEDDREGEGETESEAEREREKERKRDSRSERERETEKERERERKLETGPAKGTRRR